MLNISNREKEVLDLIAYEYTMSEIAQELFISFNTVISHRKNLMLKLGVKNTAGLMRVAFERGIFVVSNTKRPGPRIWK